MDKYAIYMGFTKFINHSLNIYVFEISLYLLSYVKKKTKSIFILDIGDQNTTFFCIQGHLSYVF